jgi:hypothetical protein
VYAIRRRSLALAQLPGPEYPFIFGVFDLLKRKDVHRAATELAEQYGPLIKLRLMSFHVSVSQLGLRIHCALSQPFPCDRKIMARK